MFKGVGVRFAAFILSLFPETKLFHFHRIIKNKGQGWGFERTP